ncbi:YchJ family protein [Tessaracoccus flavus]
MADCPCGGGSWDECCGPLLAGTRQAGTAEALMRSRYSAFVFGDSDHLWRTWHPRTRPASVDAAGVEWLRLEVLDVVGGGEDDAEGVVEFDAHHAGGVLHERSRFARRAGRWFYLDAATP